MIAKRNAVEKALGAAISINMVPDKRELVSRTEGNVTYEILDEGEKDGFYVVTIMAKVEIPELLTGTYPLSDEERELDTGYKALNEEFPQGRIDWEKGYLIAYGEGSLKSDKKDKKDELMARRAAIADAQAKTLEMINGIRVDAEKQVKGALVQDKALYYKLEGLVRDAVVIDETKGNPYKVSLRVPLTGVKGVSRLFYNQEASKRVSPPETGESDEEESEYTGLVIDARGTGLKTAFMPEVISENGESLYSSRMVESDALIKRGVVAYALAEEEAKIGDRVGERPLIIKGSLPAYPMIASLDTPALSASWFEARAVKDKKTGEKKKTRRRQGRRPLTIKSSSSSGSFNANIVISSSDAKKIASSRKFAKVFRQSRVIVLTDSMIGGTEGHLSPGSLKVAELVEN